LRWAIIIVDLDPIEGHEEAGQRRALVVSNEPFHRSGMATVCPISAREPKYPGEVPVAVGVACQTKTAVILTHQARTIDLTRVRAWALGGAVQYLADVAVRTEVRAALAHHLALDVPETEHAIP
jgi:mRNA interferase MazF